MSAHTPGLRLGDLTFHMGADYVCVMGERQTTDTAIIRLFGQSRDVEAYGRLIAAAPDMLAILKDMRNAPDPYDGVGGWWEEIDAAIAKATEGQS